MIANHDFNPFSLGSAMGFNLPVFGVVFSRFRYSAPTFVLNMAEPNGRGTLSPRGRENSPYRHAPNKDSISTPELGGVFRLPASRRPVCAFSEPTGERNLLKVSWRRPGIASPPESPWALCNHLCIVVALGEEG
jgi:hypothetical protein